MPLTSAWHVSDHMRGDNQRMEKGYMKPEEQAVRSK